MHGGSTTDKVKPGNDVHYEIGVDLARAATTLPVQSAAAVVICILGFAAILWGV